MKTAIKAVGTYPIEIRLGRSVVAKAAVDVIAERA
jgi:ribosomal protein L9